MEPSGRGSLLCAVNQGVTPLWQDLSRDASFWAFLRKVDEGIASDARSGGCLFCGAPLHSASYKRKLRGPEVLADGTRFSFCCSMDSCRKRLTPPSVRFLGRKVFVMASVVLVAAMRQGPTPARVRRIARLVGVSRRSVSRWTVWWTESFPKTALWQAGSSRFDERVDPKSLPSSLLVYFNSCLSLCSSPGRSSS